MGRRVDRRARALGMDEAGRRLLARTHALAMEVRHGIVDDDHEPPFLHPGRSALVLLLDVRETDPWVLAAAMGIDSQVPEHAPDPDRLDPRVRSMVEQVPGAGAEDLAERLVVAPDPVRRAALAERLDHLRHAHLWPDLEARRRAHAEAEAIYAPVARRTHAALAHRYDWWCRMFGSRHLG